MIRAVTYCVGFSGNCSIFKQLVLSQMVLYDLCNSFLAVVCCMDPSIIFTEPVLFSIFDDLRIADILRCSLVCKTWNKVAKSEKLWRGERGSLLHDAFNIKGLHALTGNVNLSITKNLKSKGHCMQRYCTILVN